MNKTLPVFEMRIDEKPESELQVDFIALVDLPAIERNFLAFNNKQSFAVNDEKRIISGPAMLADMPIYRRDDEHGEYYVTFSKETIYKIAQKFFQNDYHKNFNNQHQGGTLQDITVFESFIVDSSRGIAPMKGFEDVKDGSWFISAKVTNDEVWAKVKSGEFKGFSVEGMFAYGKKPKTPEQVYAEIKELLAMIP
jgi:hypothetical protein